MKNVSEVLFIGVVLCMKQSRAETSFESSERDFYERVIFRQTRNQSREPNRFFKLSSLSNIVDYWSGT